MGCRFMEVDRRCHFTFPVKLKAALKRQGIAGADGEIRPPGKQALKLGQVKLGQGKRRDKPAWNRE
jgi:hypothetical protein